ncbi:hypothetical protein B0H13DRAFT_1869284 [Mycena leptocephala]|nr:hypothetical protein B0H13DRAFT_1869284 [Mycena leptocephala]
MFYSSIAYTAALPIQELHQVRNYTACTFDPPPAFLARFPSGLSPKNSGALHWWTTGIKHAGLRWVQIFATRVGADVPSSDFVRAVRKNLNQYIVHANTYITGTHAYGVQDTVAAGWEGSGILRRSPTRPALMREVRKQWQLAEHMGCRVIRGQRRTSPLPSCSVEVADPEVW